MALLFPSFPEFFPLLLFIFMVLKLGKRLINNCSTTAKRPPGPWKLPIIGNIHHMIGGLPHQRITDLAKKYGPLMYLQLGEVPAIFISSAEMAKHVFRTQEGNFSTRAPSLVSKIMFYDSTDMVFAPYGDYWRQMRKICTVELFSVKRVQSYKSIRDEEVMKLVKSIASSSSSGMPINLTEKIHALTYSATARAAFGKRCKEQDQFIKIARYMIEVAGGFNVVDYFPSIKFLHVMNGMKPTLEKLSKETDQLLENIINTHREDLKSRTSKGDEAVEEDLVDVLLKVKENDGDLDFPITTNNIKGVLHDIFLAGSDTSANTTEWMMAELMKHPKAMEKAQAEVRQVFDSKNGKIDETDFHELKYLKLVIKEGLRLHPVAPLMLPRESKERCEIDGYEIPSKSHVIVNAWAIGRDPNYWTEPERFIPERFLHSSLDFNGARLEYIPFGAGRKMCPGLVFGLAIVEIQLAYLLYHFDWKLPNNMKPEDLEMVDEFGSVVRRKGDLNLIPIPYSRPSSIAS